MQRIWSWLTLGACAAMVSATPGMAQEIAFKGFVARSNFAESGTGTNPWTEDLTSTGFGGHVRFRFGPFGLQPELQIVTRGTESSAPMAEEAHLRIEYLELPLLIVFPLPLGRLEPYAFGGGMVALESRCRYAVREEGLRSNFACDSPSGSGAVFERRKADYGVVGGGGLSYRVGSGRILLEARHTWGMRNIVSDESTLELRNRTLMIGIGYSISMAQEP
jgi:hypothetical protein